MINIGQILIVVTVVALMQQQKNAAANILDELPASTLNIDFIQKKLADKQLNCSDVVDYFLERSFFYNRYLNTIISFNFNQAKLEAIRQDEYYYKNGTFVGRLHCVPLLVKDLIDVAGLPTTGGIKALRYSIPNEDAFVVAQLKQAGAIVLGKTNLAELGLGIRYSSEVGGSCRNPFDLTRSCGASSSGSAASTAIGLALITLGTDTDGSIIVPACFNGINGIRPATDAMNMSGIIPLFEAQDTVGPLANNLDDMALVYSIMLNNESVYSDYKDLLNRPHDIRIGFINNTFTNFTLNTVIGTYYYSFDEDFKVALREFVENLKKILNVIEISQSTEMYDQFINSLEPIVLNRIECTESCAKLSIEGYFNKSNRFYVDAPYHSFDEMRQSPLLSTFWKDFLNEVNVENPDQSCKTNCADYKNHTAHFTHIIDNWFNMTQADVLIYPSANTRPNLIDDIDQQIQLIIIASFTRYATINVPAGFVVDSSTRKSFPTGMTMLAKPANVAKLFAASRLYERAYGDTKRSFDPNLPVFSRNNQKNSNSCRSKHRDEHFLLPTIVAIIILFKTIFSSIY